MARSTLKYTYIAKRKYWRFRHPLVGDVPLPGSPEDAAFHVRYGELLAKVKAGPKASPARSTFAWLIAEYRASAEFEALRPKTRDDYELTLDLIKKELGDQPFELTTRRMIKEVRDSYRATPRKADKIRQMTSRLYSWADEAELVPEGFNPAAGLKKLKHRVNPYVPWSDEEIEHFLAHAPSHVITPVMIALFTGQRASDVAAMTWTQFKGGTIRVRQNKTGELLDIACHPKLREHLETLKAGKRKGVVIATSIEHRSYTSNSLAQALARSIALIDEMPHRTMHGLRYAAAARLEEAGSTMVEIVAILGHRTYQMGMKYAAQRKAAQGAISKLEKSQ